MKIFSCIVPPSLLSTNDPIPTIAPSPLTILSTNSTNSTNSYNNSNNSNNSNISYNVNSTSESPMVDQIPEYNPPNSITDEIV